MFYVIPVPYRFKKDVCKPENEHVLNRLFTQIMIDSVDLLLPKNLGEEPVEILCTFQIISEWFFHYDPCSFTVVAEIVWPFFFSYGLVQLRGYGKLKNCFGSFFQSFPDHFRFFVYFFIIL